MYCPSCGTELLQEMSYCNRCGASLKTLVNQADDAPVQRVNATGAAWAISIAVAFITLGGFALIFAMVMALVTRGVPFTDGPTAMIVFSLLVILVVDWLLIRQLPRLLGLFQFKSEKEESKKTERKKPELSAKPRPQIAAQFEPSSSVTDHTTRTFEPVYRERDTQR
jgi:hypothetical protein